MAALDCPTIGVIAAPFSMHLDMLNAAKMLDTAMNREASVIWIPGQTLQKYISDHDYGATASADLLP